MLRPYGKPYFLTITISVIRDKLFFTDQKVKDFASAKTSDTARFGKYFLSMLANGVNLAPSQFEAAFMSLAHTRADINRTLEAARKSLKAL